MLEIKNNDTARGAKILVAGIGGCGNNAVNRMIDEGIQGVDFIGMNTDKQALDVCKAPQTLQLGEKLTKGLGAGAKPEIGEKAAEESYDDIANVVSSYDMVFVTCGMGGGTGTGAAPIVAKICKDAGILTVGVVTKPFFYEGNRRMMNAAEGIERISECVDTLIVIPNDKIYDILDAKTDYAEGLRKADEVLQQAVRGITDIISKNSLINLDFADIQTAMRDKGIAHIGIGTGKGDDRAMEAVKVAVESPLLETKLDGATDIIVNMSGDIDIISARDAMEYILNITGSEVNVLFGVVGNKEEEGVCGITVIATGIDGARKAPGTFTRGAFQSRPVYGSPTRTSSASIRSQLGTGASAMRNNNAAANAQSAAAPSGQPQPAQQPVKREFTTQRPVDIRGKVQDKQLNIPSFLQNK